MSVVFEPHKIGKLEVKNRFVHSATFESMAAEECIVQWTIEESGILIFKLTV